MTKEEALILIVFLEGHLKTGSPSLRDIIKYLERKMEPLLPVERYDLDKKEKEDSKKDLKKGFTLLELILVVAITSILATVGISSYVNHSRSKLLDTTSQEVVSYLRYAQHKSMAQEGGNQWGIHFENSDAGGDFYGLYKGITYSGSEETRYLPKGISFATPGDNETIDIPFYKLIGDSMGGRIVMCGYFDECVSITVSSVGLISYGGSDMVIGYAWNSRAGWINFGYSGGNVFVPDGAGELSGRAHSKNLGWVSLNCISTDSCESVQYKVSSDADGNLSGWAWSENNGWISFNCSTDDSCDNYNYKVTMNQATGDFDGYAWSQNLGWISFNCATGGFGQKNICDLYNYKVQKL